jgi:hypothetical protein
MAVLVVSASAVWLPGRLFPDRFRQTFDQIEMGMTVKQVEGQINPAGYPIDDSWSRTIFNGSEHTWQSERRLMVVRFTADGRAYSKEYGVMGPDQSFLSRLESWLREVASRVGM